MIKNIELEAIGNSPKIILDADQGLIEFEGRCHPENTFKFFDPIKEWLSEYFDGNSKTGTVINFKLTYFNSATTQVLFDLLEIIEDGTHNELYINWYYDSNNKNGLDDYEDFSDEFESLNIQAIAYK